MSEILHETVIPGGGMWSGIVGRHKTLRMTDLEGGANVGMLLYHARERTERYNMPDTLKGQHIFFLTHPWCLHSDMGRVLASITRDTCGWHDTVCGCSDAALVREQYGARDFQTARNDFFRNGREGFLIELEKWGLGPRDLVPNINWFSKVTADDAGALRFEPGHSSPGAEVDLRFEMDTLVVLNTSPHPLDPTPEYAPGPVRLTFLASCPPSPEDPCRLSRPENTRAFENTELHHLLRGF